MSLQATVQHRRLLVWVQSLALVEQIESSTTKDSPNALPMLVVAMHASVPLVVPVYESVVLIVAIVVRIVIANVTAFVCELILGRLRVMNNLWMHAIGNFDARMSVPVVQLVLLMLQQQQHWAMKDSMVVVARVLVVLQRAVDRHQQKTPDPQSQVS